MLDSDLETPEDASLPPQSANVHERTENNILFANECADCKALEGSSQMRTPFDVPECLHNSTHSPGRNTSPRRHGRWWDVTRDEMMLGETFLDTNCEEDTDANEGRDVSQRGRPTRTIV